MRKPSPERVEQDKGEGRVFSPDHAGLVGGHGDESWESSPESRSGRTQETSRSASLSYAFICSWAVLYFLLAQEASVKTHFSSKAVK